MDQWNEFLKDILLFAWLIYYTVMTLVAMFNAEEAIDILIGIVLWCFVFILSTGLRWK